MVRGEYDTCVDTWFPWHNPAYWKAGCLVDAFPVLSRLIHCLLAERRCDMFRCDEAKLHGAGDWASGFFVFSFLVFVIVVDFDCFVFFLARFHDYIYCDSNLPSLKAKSKENVRL